MKKKNKNQEEKQHPYDFSEKRVSRHERITMRNITPIPEQEMAKGLIKTHGAEKALSIVEPLTKSSFVDAQGTPVAVNSMSKYWTKVLFYLKGKTNAKAA